MNQVDPVRLEVIRNALIAGAEEMNVSIWRTARSTVEKRKELSARIEADPEFEMAVPAPLNLLCFRHLGGDSVNKGIMDALNSSGELYLTQNRVRGRYALRFSVGARSTTRARVMAAWTVIRETAAALAGS